MPYRISRLTGKFNLTDLPEQLIILAQDRQANDIHHSLRACVHRPDLDVRLHQMRLPH